MTTNTHHYTLWKVTKDIVSAAIQLEPFQFVKQLYVALTFLQRMNLLRLMHVWIAPRAFKCIKRCYYSRMTKTAVFLSLACKTVLRHVYMCIFLSV